MTRSGWVSFKVACPWQWRCRAGASAVPCGEPSNAHRVDRFFRRDGGCSRPPSPENLMQWIRVLWLAALAALAQPACAADKIALVVKSLGNGFFDAARQGAQEAARE